MKTHLAATRRRSWHGFAVLLGGVLLQSGCGNGIGGASGIITEAPGNWQVYENQTITLHGDAANSPSGPFIRLNENARLSIVGIPGWTIDYVGRPVGVEGKIVRGTDSFADRYVLQLQKYYRVKTDQQPITITPPEPEQPQLPTKRGNSKK